MGMTMVRVSSPLRCYVLRCSTNLFSNPIEILPACLLPVTMEYTNVASAIEVELQLNDAKSAVTSVKRPPHSSVTRIAIRVTNRDDTRPSGLSEKCRQPNQHVVRRGGCSSAATRSHSRQQCDVGSGTQATSAVHHAFSVGSCALYELRH